MIISASRRTDIPTYYSEWFVNRLKEGYVLTRNPINPTQISRIDLAPERIDCIVFWTKDALPILNRLSIIDALGYHYYFQFTLTPYGKDIECNLRDKSAIIETFMNLSERIGQERVVWRYDPILLNDRLTVDYHLEKYEKMCQRLKGYTDSCTISFVDLYRKLLKSGRNIIQEISKEQMHQLAAGMAEISRVHGIDILTCCEIEDFSKYRIKTAACIDKERVEKVCGHPIKADKDRNQRSGCGCVKSVDIGIYNTCNNGCVYCYANHSTRTILKNNSLHSPDSDILIGRVSNTENIIIRR